MDTGLFFLTSEILSRIEPSFCAERHKTAIPSENESPDFRARTMRVIDKLVDQIGPSSSQQSASFFGNVSSDLSSDVAEGARDTYHKVSGAVEELHGAIARSPQELEEFFDWNCQRIEKTIHLVFREAHNILPRSDDKGCGDILIWPASSLMHEPFRILSSLFELSRSKRDISTLYRAAVTHQMLIATSLALESIIRSAATALARARGAAESSSVSIMLHENIRTLFCDHSPSSQEGSLSYLQIGVLLWCTNAHSAGMHLRNMALHGCLLPWDGNNVVSVRDDTRGLRYLETLKFAASMAMFSLAEVLLFYGSREGFETSCHDYLPLTSSTGASRPHANNTNNNNNLRDTLLASQMWAVTLGLPNNSHSFNIISNCAYLEHLLRTGGGSSLPSLERNRPKLGSKFVGLDSLLVYDYVNNGRPSFPPETTSVCAKAVEHLGLNVCAMTGEHLAFWLHGLLEAPFGPNLRDQLVHFKKSLINQDEGVIATVALGAVVGAMLGATQEGAVATQPVLAYISDWQRWLAVPVVLREIQALPMEFFGCWNCMNEQDGRESSSVLESILDIEVTLPTIKAPKAANTPLLLTTSVFPLDSAPTSVSAVYADDDDDIFRSQDRLLGEGQCNSSLCDLLNRIRTVFSEPCSSEAAPTISLLTILRFAQLLCITLDVTLLVKANSKMDSTTAILDPTCLARAGYVRSVIKKFHDATSNGTCQSLVLYAQTLTSLLCKEENIGQPKSLKDNVSHIIEVLPATKDRAWAWLLHARMPLLFGRDEPTKEDFCEAKSHFSSPLGVLYLHLFPKILSFYVTYSHPCESKSVNRQLNSLVDTFVKVLVPAGKKPNGSFRSVSHATVGMFLAMVDLLALILQC